MARAHRGRAALDRILRDEVRHRDFGWDALDWLCVADPGTPARVADHRRPPGWGLAPPREYAAILATTIEKDYKARFTARGIAFAVR